MRKKNKHAVALGKRVAKNQTKEQRSEKARRSANIRWTRVKMGGAGYLGTLYNERVKVAENMQKYGGGFVKALGKTIEKADSQNLIIIKKEFQKYWNEYLIK